MNYAYGNFELSRNDLAAARGLNAEACRILKRGQMRHLLLSAGYYRMAILMERDGVEEIALRLLDKGLDITKHRKGNGDSLAL